MEGDTTQTTLHSPANSVHLPVKAAPVLPYLHVYPVLLGSTSITLYALKAALPPTLKMAQCVLRANRPVYPVRLCLYVPPANLADTLTQAIATSAVLMEWWRYRECV